MSKAMWSIVREHPKKTLVMLMIALVAAVFCYALYVSDCSYLAERIRRDVMFRNGSVCVFLVYPHSYPHWTVLEGADPKTINRVEGIAQDLFRDTYNVYVGDKKIEGADPHSVQVVKEANRYMWKDKNHAYWIDQIMLGDPSTIEVLEGNYYRDADNIYYYYHHQRNSPLPFVDKTSFEVIGRHGYYAKDKKRVYYDGLLVEGADAETFQSVLQEGFYFWQDKKSVYVWGKSIPGVDKETFVELEGGDFDGFGRDKFRCYDPHHRHTLKIRALSECE